MASALRQALVLILLGATLGVVGDLVHSQSVLRQTDATLRDLELLPEVFLWSAPDAAAAFRAGEVVLLDVRPAAAVQAQRVAGCLRGDPTATRLVDADTEAELAGRDVVVVAEAAQHELARQVAANLVLLHGAGRAITLDGGFAALRETDLPMEEGR